MRADLDTYLETCSQRRLHHGRRREVHTPYQGLTPASRSPRMPERGAQDEGSLDRAPARAECQVITISLHSTSPKQYALCPTDRCITNLLLGDGITITIHCNKARNLDRCHYGH